MKAVIAESFERIHRSNLVGMGILPLQMKPGDTRETIGLTGRETFSIRGINEMTPGGSEITVEARDGDRLTEFTVTARIDTPSELEYFRHGGILLYMLRQIVSEASEA